MLNVVETVEQRNVMGAGTILYCVVNLSQEL